MVCFPALIRSGSSSPSNGKGPIPSMPFSLCSCTVMPGGTERRIGDEALFHQVSVAVELAQFLALGDQRADAGLGEKGGDTGAAGADALGERALRIEFELELAFEVELGEQPILADIG